MVKLAELRDLYDEFVEVRTAFEQKAQSTLERLKHFQQVDKRDYTLFYDLILKEIEVNETELIARFRDIYSQEEFVYKLSKSFIEVEEQEFLDALKAYKQQKEEQLKNEREHMIAASKSIRRMQYEELKKEFENDN